MTDESEVLQTLQKFQDGYRSRDTAKLDEIMQLFEEDERIELIGIGASKRGGAEWFEGTNQVREIIEGDWKYWGDVSFDVAGAKVTIHGDVAWLSTTGTVTQTQDFDTAIQYHLEDMKAFFDREDLSVEEKIMEATHYGMRRLRERSKGVGFEWPFTLTAVLIKKGGEWHFHSLHWAMPVD